MGIAESAFDGPQTRSFRGALGSRVGLRAFITPKKSKVPPLRVPFKRFYKGCMGVWGLRVPSTLQYIW